MIKINTTQFGPIGIGFHHRSCDPQQEMYRTFNKVNNGDLEQTKKDVAAVNKLIATSDAIKLYIDTKKRETTAVIRLDTPVRCFLHNGEHEVTEVQGHTKVHMSDQYNKEDGRVHALEYAIQQLPGVTSKTYREIFEGYHGRAK